MVSNVEALAIGAVGARAAALAVAFTLAACATKETSKSPPQLVELDDPPRDPVLAQPAGGQAAVDRCRSERAQAARADLPPGGLVYGLSNPREVVATDDAAWVIEDDPCSDHTRVLRVPFRGEPRTIDERARSEAIRNLIDADGAIAWLDGATVRVAPPGGTSSRAIAHLTGGATSQVMWTCYDGTLLLDARRAGGEEIVRLGLDGVRRAADEVCSPGDRAAPTVGRYRFPKPPTRLVQSRSDRSICGLLADEAHRFAIFCGDRG